jgi:hypothetical protein
VTSVERLLAALALCGALAAAWQAPQRAADRAVLVAVDAEAFSALSGRRPAADGALWERLKAMGVSAAVLREESLSDLASRAEILSFSRAEVEKWRAAGLVSPSSGIRGGTLWAKDPKSLARASEALAARGIDASTAVVAGAKALELPAGVDLSRVPAGFDPAEVAALSSAGLIPVAASSDAAVSVAGRRLWMRSLRADAPPGEVLRASLGRPMRLLVFRPVPERGLDENLESLRAALRVVRDADQSSVLPDTRHAPDVGDFERRVRLALVWFLGAAGPLLAARGALHSARAVRAKVAAWAPLAAPVPQVLAGLGAAWALSAFAGLAVAGAAPLGWRDGGARAWMLWTWCAPVAVGASALFASSTGRRGRGWAAPVRRGDLVLVAGLVAAAALLLAPRAAVRASALWESFDRVSAAGALWWWPWHWREALLGVPCLATALALIEGRDAAAAKGRHAEETELSDPRVWLVLGLLGPAGLVAAVGGGGSPLSAAVAHGAAAWGLGMLLAFALAGARGLASLWAQGPKTHRTIDLETDP